MRDTMIGAMLLAMAGLPAIAATPASAVAAAPAASLAQPASQATAGHEALPAGQRNHPIVVEHYVDINSASRKELMTLPGIGAAEADKIIAHRPYLSKTELVTKNVLPVGPYLSLKNLVVAMQNVKPKGKS